MKRTLIRLVAASVAACLCACLCVSGGMAGAGVDFLFTLADGQATIVRYNSAEAVLAIPDQIDGYPVVAIGDGAFADQDGLIAVSVPGSVASIGSGAFSRCRNLAVVVLPENAVAMGEGAFADCENVTLLTGRDGWATQYAQQNALRHALILESPMAADSPAILETELALIRTGDYVYALSGTQAIIAQYTGSAAELVIPEQLAGHPVTQIEGGAFAGLDSLVHVTIPQSVTSIGGGAFASCTNLASIGVHVENPVFVSVEGVLFDALQETLAVYPAGRGESAYTVPERTKNIGPGAFAGSRDLASVVIPEGVVFIDSYAFAWCSELATLAVPKSVASIGLSAFVGCDSLTLTLSANSYAARYAQENALHFTMVTDSPMSAFTEAETEAEFVESQFFFSGDFGCILTDGKVTILNYIGNEAELVIPDRIEGYPVAAIGDSAFFNRSQLRAVVVPDSVSSIGAHAFGACDNLTLFANEGSYAARYSQENVLRHASAAGAAALAVGEGYPVAGAGVLGVWDDAETAREPELEKARVTTTGTNLNIRRTPDSKSNRNIVVSVPNGATVWIESRSGGWAKVLFVDRRGTQYEGYAYLKFLKVQ